MSAHRIFQDQPLIPKDTFYLDSRASHYVSHVLRAKLGDHLQLFNGADNKEYTAIILKINKKGIEVLICQPGPSLNTESSINIHLGQGMPKGEKMDLIVQKATELGLSRLSPLMTERSNIKLDAWRAQNKLKHWQGIAVSACEQSGRIKVPEINKPQLLNEWLSHVSDCPGGYPGYVLSPHIKIHQPFRELTTSKEILLLIGPEGGLSPAEIDAAIHLGFTPLYLGPRILRTETAAIAAITLIQAYYGDMRSRQC